MFEVLVNKRGAERFRQGLVWVFRADLLGEPQVSPGDLVRVRDADSNVIGWAFYGPSALALRLLTREDKKPDQDFFARRLQQAIARRREFLSGRDAMRMVHGEADGLPGFLVDQFGDGVVLQSLCLAIDQREPMLIELLHDLLHPRVIVVRNDGMTREYEGLEDKKFIASGADSKVEYHEGTVCFSIDLMSDQKTGAFLDQYDNHLIAGNYARGHALDLFCYHGGFALQMSQRAAHVIGVDQNELAITRARYHAELNNIGNTEWRCENAFDILREYEAAGKKFHTIVIDPPSFAKRKSALEAAMRGYKELNLRAMKLLTPGGILVTCSCSAKVSRHMFEELLIASARDARRKFVILQRRGAGIDHPALLGVPETEYLKCFVLQALS